LDSFAQCGPKQTCRLLLEVRCDVTVNVGSHLKRTVAKALLNDLHWQWAIAATHAVHGIRVNSVSPGLIATPTIRQILADVPEILMSVVNRTYNRRPGNAEEVAAAALFLVSDESSYLSGANLVVDGGTTVLI
jgi:NAD(P)-dependent dehydrogenase (short-subunit alcohol dehydrogenase family)